MGGDEKRVLAGCSTSTEALAAPRNDGLCNRADLAAAQLAAWAAPKVAFDDEVPGESAALAVA
jgi:hypothetical protein